MGLLDKNKLNISFKKLLGKGHTQESFAASEEFISSNVSISYSTIFGEKINPNPVSDLGLNEYYDTDGVVEKIRFQIEEIPDTQIGTNQSQGYRLKLPSDYSLNGHLKNEFGSNTLLYESLGKLQISPPLYGELKGDGSTEYDPKLYETDGITEITKFSSINWNLDLYSGIIFVQDPPSGFDISVERPGFLDAYLYVGNYLDNYEPPTGGTTGITTGVTTNIKTTIIATSETYNVKTTDGYVGCSGSTIINLPSSPLDGQEVIISDMIGDAYVNEIRINGNGKNIVDDTYSTVSTNFGSMTLLYNGFFWSVISIVS